MGQLLIVVLMIILLPLVMETFSPFLQWVFNTYSRIRQRLAKGRDLKFDGTYVDVKTFYVRVFNQVPCICFVNNIDGGEVFKYIQEGKAGKVIGAYQRTYYNWQR